MKITLSTNYKNIKIEVVDEIDTATNRAKLVRQIKYCMDNIDESIDNFHVLKDDKTEIEEYENFIDPLEELEPKSNNEGDYLKPTNNQLNYLRSLGASDDQISKIRYKKEASALISELQNKKV